MKFFLVSLVALAILVLIAVRFLRGRIPSEPNAASEGSPARVVASARAREVSDVSALSIALDINHEPSLFIMLSADGSIKRMGTGTIEKPERELFIGKSDPAIFEAVRLRVTATMLQHLGMGYRSENQLGAACKLTLTFQFKDGTSNGCAFFYGSESEGAPEDVADLVTEAVRQTDPWYEGFKRTAAARHHP